MSESGHQHEVVLQNAKSRVHLIGVAHVSPRSTREVVRRIHELFPTASRWSSAPSAPCYWTCSCTPPSRAVLPPLSLDTARKHWRDFIDPLYWFHSLPMMGIEALRRPTARGRTISSRRRRIARPRRLYSHRPEAVRHAGALPCRCVQHGRWRARGSSQGPRRGPWRTGRERWRWWRRWRRQSRSGRLKHVLGLLEDAQALQDRVHALCALDEDEAWPPGALSASRAKRSS